MFTFCPLHGLVISLYPPPCQTLQALTRINEEASRIDDILLEDDFSPSPPPPSAPEAPPEAKQEGEEGAAASVKLEQISGLDVDTKMDDVSLPPIGSGDDDPMALDSAPATEWAAGEAATGALNPQPDPAQGGEGAAEAGECGAFHDPLQPPEGATSVPEPPPPPMSRRRLFILQSCSHHIPTPSFENAMLEANRAVMQVRM